MPIFNNSNILSNLRVLYAEDDTETREELQSILELYVAELYIAKNGREGLDLYKKYFPDIVITDIQMPEMNGLSMAADIRVLNSQQPIIILSAYNDVEYLFRALELGIQHYITKPISIERLLNKLAELTERMQLLKQVEENRRLLEQYKMLVDEKAIVVKMDKNGNIIYMNQQFCEISGYSEAELLGQYYLFSLDEDGQQDVLNDIKQSLEKNNKWQGILKKRAKSGCIYVVDVTLVAIIDALT